MQAEARDAGEASRARSARPGAASKKPPRRTLCMSGSNVRRMHSTCLNDASNVLRGPGASEPAPMRCAAPSSAPRWRRPGKAETGLPAGVFSQRDCSAAFSRCAAMQGAAIQWCGPPIERRVEVHNEPGRLGPVDLCEVSLQPPVGEEAWPGVTQQSARGRARVVCQVCRAPRGRGRACTWLPGCDAACWCNHRARPARRAPVLHLYCAVSVLNVSFVMYDVSATKCAAPGTSQE